MPKRRLTDTEIAIRIVPKHLRWPESSRTIAWTKAHACVDALKDFVRKVDFDCAEVEETEELSAAAIRSLSFAIGR